MIRLGQQKMDFYCPLIEKRYRSPAGRIRSSWLPVFNGYLLLFGDWDARYFAYTTDYVARDREVAEPHVLAEFLRDIRQIRGAILSGAQLTPEAKIEAGERVIVKNGPFKGYEGTVMRREGKTRCLLTVDFLEQGVSMEIDDASSSVCRERALGCLEPKGPGRALRAKPTLLRLLHGRRAWHRLPWLQPLSSARTRNAGPRRGHAGVGFHSVKACLSSVSRLASCGMPSEERLARSIDTVTHRASPQVRHHESSVWLKAKSTRQSWFVQR
ncbi:MAG: hypothetical protein R3B96_14760 [Pirellulaceae bacterium]